MGKFTLENQGSDINLVYEIGENEQLDSFAKGMLQNNDIEGVIKPAFMQKDAQQFVKYNVTSRLPLSEYFQGKLTKEKIATMFMSMAAALENAEEYMLMPKNFLLDAEHVYVDLSKKEASLIYLPVDTFSQDDTLKDFCKKILMEGTFEEYEDLSYVGKLLNFFNQNKGETPEQIGKFMKGLLDEGKVLAKPSQKTVRPEQRPANNGPVFKPAGGQGQGNFKPASSSGSAPAPGQPIPRPAQVQVQIQTPPPAPSVKPAVPPFLQRQGQAPAPGSGMPVPPQNPGFQQQVPPMTPPPGEKKKGLFGGREDKKAAKEAAKAARKLRKQQKRQQNMEEQLCRECLRRQGCRPLRGCRPRQGCRPLRECVLHPECRQYPG